MKFGPLVIFTVIVSIISACTSEPTNSDSITASNVNLQKGREIAASERGVNSPAPIGNLTTPYQNVLTVGGTRVSLLSIGRVTIFEEQNGHRESVPYLQMLFLIENFAKDELNTLCEVTDFVDGKELKPPPPVETSESKYDMRHMPQGPWTAGNTKGHQAEGYAFWLRDDGTCNGKCTVKLRVGANDKASEFRFENVPLR